MECNREEAIRGKEIAEQKMRSMDFVTAHRVALRAQRLYGDLDNISQMIMVCTVHCAADKKLFGNEKDWYGILQVEQTADEATIKKQYRKLALLLHPDKNKFPGAEAAFKLIGEAHMVLSDKGKRSLHDIKRKASMSKPAVPYVTQQSAAHTKVATQNNHASNSASFNPQQQQTQQSAYQQKSSNGQATFWTACTFCKVKYQYYVEFMHRILTCQYCKQNFIARESCLQPAATGSNLNQSAIPSKKDAPNNGYNKVKVNHPNNSGAEQSKTEFFQKKVCKPDLASQKANGKRKKNVLGDTDTDSRTNIEDVIVDEADDFKEGLNSRCSGEFQRRSDRSKQKVSYQENLGDDEDFAIHPKRARGSGPSCATEEECRNGSRDGLACEKDHGGEKQKAAPKSSLNENGHEKSNKVQIDSTSDPSSRSTSDPETYEYPEPDFNDFDKLRSDGCFSVGQIWAVYDTLDAMPRFYARIRKVHSPVFKLRITWLEPKPSDKDAVEWVDEDLPFSCGDFKQGASENTDGRLMFSHIIQWEKGRQKDTYKIFPRKGEVWAIFKNWDINWKSNVDPNLKFQYEFVEILSEYSGIVGLTVAYLGKVKGFASLFCRISKDGKDTYEIPAGELLSFSHMIPSFKLTGEESHGVPKGSFELDPASLPKNIEEIIVPEETSVDIGKSKTHADITESRSSDKVKADVEPEGNNSPDRADLQGADLEPEIISDGCDSPIPSAPENIEIPEPEFFNFDAEKSIEKFKVGQIWSLYSDEDGLPKYYGRITKISSGRSFKMSLMWLISCALPGDVIRWHDKDMPICCGRFKIKLGKSQSYSSTDAFSHQISAESASKKNEYIILPKEGQVWALYRNWSAQIKHSDLKKFEYDVAEVQEENNTWIKVTFLERVGGYHSVFKAQVKQGSAFTVNIQRVELLRFSHQIPAFQLTEEKGGSLRGYWELDLGALPVHS